MEKQRGLFCTMKKLDITGNDLITKQKYTATRKNQKLQKCHHDNIKYNNKNICNSYSKVFQNYIEKLPGLVKRCTKIIFISAILINCITPAEALPPANRGVEKLCGARLVDALRFLCGARGIYTPTLTGNAPTRSRYRETVRKPSADITELCCQQGCTIVQLEQYCGSTAPLTSADKRLQHYRHLTNMLPYGTRRRAFRRLGRYKVNKSKLDLKSPQKNIRRKQRRKKLPTTTPAIIQ